MPIRPGARPYYNRALAGIIGVTVHWTASPCRNGVEAVEAIARYQTSPQVFDDEGNRIGGPQEAFPAVAYSLMTDGRGTIYLCHDLSVRTWHSAAVVNGVARNASHIGIAIINDTTPSDAQLRGLADAIRWCERDLGRPLQEEGHKDSVQTACPGPTWSVWRERLMYLVD